MVCYAIPLSAAVITFLARRVSGKARESESIRWLNLMLLGAAVALVVDHVWNGELFLISGNIASDVALGFTLTAFVLAAWVVVAACAGSAGTANARRT